MVAIIGATMAITIKAITIKAGATMPDHSSVGWDWVGS
jgi:hypothetical protein